MKLVLSVLAALTLGGLVSSTALADGPEVFRAQGCTKCHSVTVAGIQRQNPHDEEGKDLSKVGSRHDKKAIALFMLKKTEIAGEKHKKLFGGTTEQLKTVAEWLETLK